MNIDSMVIEVTRRCNMACDHCLRGEAQKKDIPDSIIDTFFEKVGGGYISNLTISGGEPSLVPHKIDTIIEAAKRHGVTFGSFYIATNGKIVPDAFLMAVMRLYLYCDDKESCMLAYSDDPHHEWIEDENREKLEIFKFTQARGESGRDYGGYEILEGRAAENGIGIREEKGINPAYFDMDSYIYDESITSEMTVYLNCKGNIICGCDWSYKSQDRKANKVCHVSDFSIDTVTAYLMQFEAKELAA